MSHHDDDDEKDQHDHDVTPQGQPVKVQIWRPTTRKGRDVKACGGGEGVGPLTGIHGAVELECVESPLMSVSN